MSARLAPYYVLAGVTPVRLVPSRHLGHGSSADVVGVQDESALAMKLYASPTGASDRLAPLLAEDARRWLDAAGQPRLAWPLAMLQDGLTGRDAGFLMPRLGAAWRPLDDLLHHDDRVVLARMYPMAFAQAPDWGALVRIAMRLSDLVAEVHAAKLVAGDLSHANALATAEGRVALVDCDDFVRDGEAARSRRTMDYAAPEVLDDPEAPATRANDAWALAVLNVRLLLDGLHPFAGRTKAGAAPQGHAGNVRTGATVFRKGRFGRSTHEAWMPPLAILPPEVRRLAEKCFMAGHRDPGKRPDAEGWAAALDRVQTAACPTRPTHVFSAHLETCPWCERVAAGHPDTFPDTQQTDARGLV